MRNAKMRLNPDFWSLTGQKSYSKVFGTRLTRNRFRIESDSFPQRSKESELLDHNFAGIVPTLPCMHPQRPHALGRALHLRFAYAAQGSRLQKH
jgi:hypothetical protein